MDDLPSYPGTARWVKVSAIIAGVVVLLLVTMMLFVEVATVLVATWCCWCPWPCRCTNRAA